jgi:hypothetical protein
MIIKFPVCELAPCTAENCGDCREFHLGMVLKPYATITRVNSYTFEIDVPYTEYDANNIISDLEKYYFRGVTIE